MENENPLYPNLQNLQKLYDSNKEEEMQTEQPPVYEISDDEDEQYMKTRVKKLEQQRKEMHKSFEDLRNTNVKQEITIKEKELLTQQMQAEIKRLKNLLKSEEQLRKTDQTAHQQLLQQYNAQTRTLSEQLDQTKKEIMHYNSQLREKTISEEKYQNEIKKCQNQLQQLNIQIRNRESSNNTDHNLRIKQLNDVQKYAKELEVKNLKLDRSLNEKKVENQELRNQIKIADQKYATNLKQELEQLKQQMFLEKQTLVGTTQLEMQQFREEISEIHARELQSLHEELERLNVKISGFEEVIKHYQTIYQEQIEDHTMENKLEELENKIIELSRKITLNNYISAQRNYTYSVQSNELDRNYDFLNEKSLNLSEAQEKQEELLKKYHDKKERQKTRMEQLRKNILALANEQNEVEDQNLRFTTSEDEQIIDDTIKRELAKIKKEFQPKTSEHQTINPKDILRKEINKGARMSTSGSRTDLRTKEDHRSVQEIAKLKPRDFTIFAGKRKQSIIEFFREFDRKNNLYNHSDQIKKQLLPMCLEERAKTYYEMNLDHLSYPEARRKLLEKFFDEDKIYDLNADMRSLRQNDKQVPELVTELEQYFVELKTTDSEKLNIFISALRKDIQEHIRIKRVKNYDQAVEEATLYERLKQHDKNYKPFKNTSKRLDEIAKRTKFYQPKDYGGNKCHYCKKKGHVYKNCRKRLRDKYRRKNKKVHQVMEKSLSDSEEELKSFSSSSSLSSTDSESSETESESEEEYDVQEIKKWAKKNLSKIQCYFCKKFGHYKSDCKKYQQQKEEMDQNEKKEFLKYKNKKKHHKEKEKETKEETKDVQYVKLDMKRNYAPMYLNGVKVNAKIDTGAEVSLIDSETYIKLLKHMTDEEKEKSRNSFVEGKDLKIQINASGKKKLPVVGKTKLNIRPSLKKEDNTDEEFYIIQNTQDILIGETALKNLDTTIDLGKDRITFGKNE